MLDINKSVETPKYYKQGEYETIDIIRDITNNCGYEGFQCFCVGSILKYLIRANEKGGVEDLRKSRDFLSWLISDVENRTC